MYVSKVDNCFNLSPFSRLFYSYHRQYNVHHRGSEPVAAITAPLTTRCQGSKDKPRESGKDHG